MYVNIWFPFCPVLLRCEQTINHATTRHAGLHFKTENQSKPYLIYVAFCQRFCHSNEQERELIDFFLKPSGPLNFMRCVLHSPQLV